MSRRLHQTLADYVVIAISPALIMLLVGSLVFFLLRVFYQGEFPERLHWVMACFVFAAVLIGRIAIEEGYERAAMYGAALAMAVGVASNRFMEYQGTWIDTFSWPINFGLIGVIWWCAHKLTWDCTVIDDSQDASGEGLLQVAGLERPAGVRNADAEGRLEGTTAREVPSGFWQRYVNQQRRPHAPGVWVVYFSLAALPLFGVGQWFIPADDTWGRRYVFWLLCIYVASGLALLVTTSFLGLRRYLRQRRIEMPTLMANLWLGTGAAIIAVLLVLAMLLPRPSAEYAVSELPFRLGSPEQNASKSAPIRRDGTQDDAPAPAAAEKEPGEESSDDNQPQGAGNQSQGKADGEGSATVKSADSKSGGAGKGKSSQEKGKPGSSASQSKQSEQSGERQGEEQKSESKSDGEKQSEFAKAVKKLQEDQTSEKREAESRAAEQQDAESDATETPGTQQVLEPAIAPAMQLIKWAIYALFGLAVLYSLWRYREEVGAAIRSFLREVAAWWRSLWGGKRDYGLAADAVLDIRIPPTPFSAYADPFASGTDASYSAEELVRYSFQAFEAWSREHGCPREPDQTPHELARDVAKLNSFIAADARHVAELHARVAYARGGVPAGSREQLRALWERMRSSPASPVAAPQAWP